MSANKSPNKPKKKFIPTRVKELREILKLTQAAFAERIDVSNNTISRIELKNMNLSSDIALRIANEFRISLDWLFYLNDNMLSPARRAKLNEAFDCMQESFDAEKSI